MEIREGLLRQIIEGVSNTYGDDFFISISLQLSRVIAVDYVFIALLNREAYQSDTIALVVKGEVQANISYSLAHTPCADVGNDSVCCYPCNVSDAYPDDQLLKDLNIQAYLGTPLRNSRGEVMGLIVAMNENPIAQPDLVLTLFEIFSGRVSAEIERRNYEKALVELNRELEQKVVQRTRALKETQEQLLESEKMAALGNLVAGVAHEVNTPLGVAITVQSVMADALTALEQAILQENLSEEQMQAYLQQVRKCLDLQESNLRRASDLIENFKRTAADQHTLELEQLKLSEYLPQVLSTLHPLLKQANAEVILQAAPELSALTYAGCHAQILTNLVSNSVRHGFAGRHNGNQIRIHLHQDSDGMVHLQYLDNGCGLSEEGRQRIFEPFYTTARAQGGTGLGMSIVYNLVTQRLRGQIRLIESAQGFGLEYTFPVSGNDDTAQRQAQ
ncbi:sensor histidine kinase [Undibacterium squillarum]|uniref:histidine kinase n=1 Tax=Undibacterium squillarum TaxID=1131567 RepID=A0ABQ2XX42_9BURK|nr:HAMP domain-containing sensor histidine kinase [Undibacterium squillarum]GGX36703.1 hypothetical protein GCM10010946_13240 [Undibacterium squillarum]